MRRNSLQRQSSESSKRAWEQRVDIFLRKKHEKYDDHIMIRAWTMENIVIIRWSCQETWPPCWRDGMIMAMIFQHGWHPKPFQTFLLTREYHKALDNSFTSRDSFATCNWFSQKFWQLACSNCSSLSSKDFSINADKGTKFWALPMSDFYLDKVGHKINVH